MSDLTTCKQNSSLSNYPGLASIEDSFPDIVKEWDVAKNEPLKPSMVGRGSEKLVWWRCSMGHSYQAMVFSRVAGTGCPYCTGKKVLEGFNDLQTTDPLLAKEWYWPLNGSFLPTSVTRGSHKKAWWCCKEGHIWQAAIYSRSRSLSSGCPVCAGKRKEGDYVLLRAARSARAPHLEEPIGAK